MAGVEGTPDEEVESRSTLVIRAEAQAEIEDVYRYYEDKAEGLGLDFLRAVEACLASIGRHPKMNAVLYKQARRGILRRFPYGLFYVLDQDHIEVIACFHASRNPKEWHKRA